MRKEEKVSVQSGIAESAGDGSCVPPASADGTARGFISAVGNQIRWKRARKPLLDELESHIADRRAALIEEGAEERKAEARAVEEMGDPEAIGLELDRVHRPKPNWAMIGCAAALLIAGMALMWSVGDHQTYGPLMVLYAAVGAVALIAGYFLDYTLLAKVPYWALFGACSLCVVLSMMSNRFYSTATQLCYFLPMLFIPLVYRTRRGTANDATLMVCGAAACFIAAVFGAGWMSLCVYMLVTCGGMILYAALKGWLGKYRRRVLLWVTIPPLALFGFLCLISFDSLASRLSVGVLHPEEDPMGMGWLPLRVRELIDSSRFFGSGETSELLDAFIAPNDLCSKEFMLAVAAHKHGLAVFVLVAALTVAMAVLLIVGIRRQSCRLGALTLLTVGLCFGVRAIGYFVNNLGYPAFYMEGLPLFSYCGKLMVLDMLMMGVLLSVFRTGSIARDSSVSPKNDTVAG